MFDSLFAQRGLSLDRLRAFLAVAEAGGITRAVGDDPVRQSQFSRQIGELEEFFGVELLRRRGKQVVVSPAGSQLARVVREQLRGLSDFAQECAGGQVSFAFGAGDSLIQWLLLPRLAGLHSRFPTVSFRLSNLTNREVAAGLRELTLDFGLLWADRVTAGLGSFPLGAVGYALLIPRALLGARRRKPEFLRALTEFPLATQTGGSQFAELRDAVAESGGQLRPALECDSYPQALGALRTGRYAAVLPKLALADLALPEFLEVTIPPQLLLPRRIVLAWNPRTLRLRTQAPVLQAALKLGLRFD